MTIETELPRTTAADVITGCCPRFHPEQWDNKEFDFSSLVFMEATSKTILHIPMDLGKVMTQAQKAIDDAHQAYEDRYLILSQDVSAFKTRHLFLVKGDVPNYPRVKLQGSYRARVFDGPYQDVPKWIKQVETEAKTDGRDLKDLWIFYTTCPKCAKTYGHNYCVVFSQ